MSEAVSHEEPPRVPEAPPPGALEVDALVPDAMISPAALEEDEEEAEAEMLGMRLGAKSVARVRAVASAAAAGADARASPIATTVSDT